MKSLPSSWKFGKRTKRAESEVKLRAEMFSCRGGGRGGGGVFLKREKLGKRKVKRGGLLRTRRD